VADSQEIAAKISETLNTADQLSTAETVQNYSLLRAQLEELDSSARRSLQSHVGYKPLLAKLQQGSPLTGEELTTLRSLIVGDADQYLKYDDDFDRSKGELGRILNQIRQLKSRDFDLETLMHLRVLCREASSALVPTVHYLEQKERVHRFEEHTRGPLSSDASRILAGIIANMAD
jgi:hypothetical protein